MKIHKEYHSLIDQLISDANLTQLIGILVTIGGFDSIIKELQELVNENRIHIENGTTFTKKAFKAHQHKLAKVTKKILDCYESR